MKKRMLSIILTLAVLVSMLIPVTGAQAALGINHELEVSLMAALGIVPGYPDNYEAGAAVKASDFAKYAYAAVGSDVGNAESFVRNQGIDPDSNITYLQAEKIIFGASDYDRVISASNSTAHEYAKASGLLNGVTYSSENDPITLEAAAVMLNNLINMNVVEYDNSGVRLGDETIMESMLNVYEGRGIVTATNETGLYGYDAVSGKNVMIGDTVYNTGTTTAQSMIGRYVKFYYKNDKQSGEYILKWIEVDNSKTKMEVIYGCDVTSASNTSITYDANTGSRKTAQISGDAEIIYNGRRSDSMTIEAVQSLTSEITLIDNDNSNAYDVVVIKDYSYYLVGSFSSDALTVNDYESQQTLDVDKNHYDVFNIYKDGAAASVSDIAAGQVLAAAISEDGRIISIDILTGSVSGEITSYSSGSVVIGGTEYSISPAYAGAQLKNGRSGTFYFDKLGKVVRCEALKAQTSKYGYLISYYSNADGSSDFEAKILTAEGNITTFKVRDTISYNDSKRTAKEVYNLLGAINGCEQLITYEINSENVITRMQTADSNYIGVDEEEPDKFTLNYSGTGKYRKNNLCFNSKYLIDSTTPIFLVPYDGERDGYAVKNASYLTNSYIYNISVYDIDEFMYASAIVLKENLIEPENMRNKRPLIVTEILNGVNDDGDQAIIVEGYQQGSKVSLALANENMNDNRGNVQVRNLKAGDVIQYGTNAKGEINVVQLLYRAQTNELSIAGGTDTPNTYWEGGTAVFPDLWASCGPVVNRSSELIMVDDDGDDTRLSKSPHVLGSVTTYLYDAGEVTVSTKNEISVNDNVYVHEYQGKVQDILIVRN